MFIELIGLVFGCEAAGRESAKAEQHLSRHQTNELNERVVIAEGP